MKKLFMNMTKWRKNSKRPEVHTEPPDSLYSNPASSVSARYISTTNIQLSRAGKAGVSTIIGEKRDGRDINEPGHAQDEANRSVQIDPIQPTQSPPRNVSRPRIRAEVAHETLLEVSESFVAILQDYLQMPETPARQAEMMVPPDGALIVGGTVSAEEFARTVEKVLEKQKEQKPGTGYRIANALGKLYPLISLTLSLGSQTVSLVGGFAPLQCAVNGVSLLLSIAYQEHSRGEDFLKQFDRILYQSLRIAEIQKRPTFEINELLLEKSITLMTAAILFFKYSLMFFRHDYFFNLGRTLLFGPKIYADAREALDTAISEFDQALLLQVTVKVLAMDSMTKPVHEQMQTESLSKLLSGHSIRDATYELQDKHPCDPHTRLPILCKILDWINDISGGSRCVFWLSGAPGVGKSSITASIARECKDRGILWAQFFINCNDIRTTDARAFFPSIVDQMAMCSPEVASAIVKVIGDRPSLLDDISEGQARSLFVHAIQVASALDIGAPVVVVIDALDETDARRLRDTVRIFSEVVGDLPCNAKVFISSRTEDVIRNYFSANSRLMHMHLSAASSTREVTTFLEKKVKEIIEDYNLDWSRWSDERMRKLSIQASGLFLWAVTAVEYIRAEVEESGAECLSSLLDELNTEGMNDINSLYMAILERTYKNRTDGWVTQRFRRIVGALLVRQSPLCLADLEPLLNLMNPTTHEPVDMIHFVRRLRTILVAGVEEINSQTIPRIHRSFAEFIISKQARGFRVDPTASNGELAIQCIRRLNQFWVSGGTSSHLSVATAYAFIDWSSHLSQLARIAARALTAGGGDSESVAASENSVSICSLSDVADARSCVKISSNPSVIPDGKIYSVVLSPDGTLIVSAYSDMTIRLWDSWTGDALLEPFKGHTGIVHYATFSPDGGRIVSASSDRTIRIWDSDTGKALLEPFKGHTDVVQHATFSPDGKRILSASSDSSIRMWDAETGKALLGPFGGHTSVVLHASFSPDGKRIVSASSDRTIRIWNAETGESLLKPLEGHTRAVHYTDFSPDGKWIVSASLDNTIRLWDSMTGLQLTDDHASAMLSFVDTEAGQYIVTPPPCHRIHQVIGALYHFNMEQGSTQGILHLGYGLWVYINDMYLLSSYQGSQVMRRTIQRL